MAVGTLRRKPMLDWIGTKILALMTLLPAVFVDEKSPNFSAIRAICHGARKTETILAYSAAAVTLLARL
jgi:hypothetical protein